MRRPAPLRREERRSSVTLERFLQVRPYPISPTTGGNDVSDHESSPPGYSAGSSKRHAEGTESCCAGFVAWGEANSVTAMTQRSASSAAYPDRQRNAVLAFAHACCPRVFISGSTQAESVHSAIAMAFRSRSRPSLCGGFSQASHLERLDASATSHSRHGEMSRAIRLIREDVSQAPATATTVPSAAMRSRARTIPSTSRPTETRTRGISRTSSSNSMRKASFGGPTTKRCHPTPGAHSAPLGQRSTGRPQVNDMPSVSAARQRPPPATLAISQRRSRCAVAVVVPPSARWARMGSDLLSARTVSLTSKWSAASISGMQAPIAAIGGDDEVRKRPDAGASFRCHQRSTGASVARRLGARAFRGRATRVVAAREDHRHRRHGGVSGVRTASGFAARARGLQLPVERTCGVTNKLSAERWTYGYLR